MKKEELDEILEKHQHYLNQDVDGWESMKADLSGADLRGADLRGADLRGADIRGADLMDANLSYANISNSDIKTSYLLYADLSYADLSNADIRNADLSYANIKHSSLCRANLCGAILKGATLYDANLNLCRFINADLSGALLCDANLQDADFEYANIANAIFIGDEEFRKGVILTESIRGWKQCAGNVIVELEIPKGAVVFGINGKKFRTNKAKVIAISEGDIAHSWFDYTFLYEVGKEIEIEDFNMIYNLECSTGIHFFKNREDAENY